MRWKQPNTAATAILVALLATVAQAQAPSSGGVDVAHLFGVDPDQLHSTPADWNGGPVVFVDFAEASGDETVRQVYAVIDPYANPTKVKVTTVEPEGGNPELAAIGFANADRDAAKELILILEWPQVHYDYGGKFVEVRIFDDPRRGQSELVQLSKLSEHFGLGCVCEFREEGRRNESYAFGTIAKVEAELRRLGY